MKRTLAVVGGLILLTVVIILAAVVLPASKRVRETAVLSRTMDDITHLHSALRTFEFEYGRFPFAPSTEDMVLISDKSLLDVLQARDEGQNPRGIVFLETNPARGERGGLVDSGPRSGYLMDYWGIPYRVVLDADGDGKVVDPVSREPVEHRIFVFSAGPDGDPDTPVDNLTSWR